jgi:hypothetical protein
VGEEPAIIRDPRLFDQASLLVVTPEKSSVNITAALTGRANRPTLFVLPKWSTRPDQKHGGWVDGAGLLPLYEPVGVLGPSPNFKMERRKPSSTWLIPDTGAAVPPAIRFRAPGQMQVITGIVSDAESGSDRILHPILTDGKGGLILARFGPGPLYVLADPDLFDNMGMKDVRQAASALALLRWLNNGSPSGIAFDVSFNGLGHSQSPLKLLFEPPFAALTVTVALALVLAGVQAFGRFGPVAPRRRAIALGKTALIDNTAALIRKAGRESGMGARYAAVVRDVAARAFGAPARLKGEALDAYLDALKNRQRFTELAASAADAHNRRDLLDAAQALHAWKGDKIR